MPRCALATLALYNVAAAANNVGQAGGGAATVVHAALAAGFVRYAAS